MQIINNILKERSINKSVKERYLQYAEYDSFYLEKSFYIESYECYHDRNEGYFIIIERYNISNKKADLICTFKLHNLYLSIIH